MTRRERRVLLCPPATGIPKPDSFLRPCADCRRDLWVEGLLIRHVDAHCVAALCAACVHTELQRCEGMAIAALPGQERQYAELGINAPAGKEFLTTGRHTSVYRELMEAIEKMARDEC